MPIKTEPFNVESMKKVMEYKKISIRSLGKKLAEIKGIDPDSGVRQLSRNLHSGSMQKQTILALANYLEAPDEWFSVDYDADQITEEEVNKWSSMWSLWNKKISDLESYDETDELFRKLFESQGYQVIKFTDGRYLFVGKVSGCSEIEGIEEHIGEFITESQYNKLIQSVLKAVNDSASELDEQLLKEEGKDNGMH